MTEYIKKLWLSKRDSRLTDQRRTWELIDRRTTNPPDPRPGDYVVLWAPDYGFIVIKGVTFDTEYEEKPLVWEVDKRYVHENSAEDGEPVLTVRVVDSQGAAAVTWFDPEGALRSTVLNGKSRERYLELP